MPYLPGLASLASQSILNLVLPDSAWNSKIHYRPCMCYIFEKDPKNNVSGCQTYAYCKLCPQIVPPHDITSHHHTHHHYDHWPMVIQHPAHNYKEGRGEKRKGRWMIFSPPSLHYIHITLVDTHITHIPPCTHTFGDPWPTGQSVGKLD